MPSSTISTDRALLFTAVVSLALGCSGEKNPVETFPVSGQVFYKQLPATGARVIFIYASKQLRELRLPTPQATVDEEGNFQVSCFDDQDGAPAGEYRIALVWRREAKKNIKGDYRPPDRLKGRYANPLRTGLTATIVDGENTLPKIQLK